METLKVIALLCQVGATTFDPKAPEQVDCRNQYVLCAKEYRSKLTLREKGRVTNEEILGACIQYRRAQALLTRANALAAGIQVDRVEQAARSAE